MDVFLLYLFTRLDVLLTVAEGLLFFSTIAALGSGFFWATSTDIGWEKSFKDGCKKTTKVFTSVSCVALLVFIVTPSKEDVAFIVAGKVGIELVQTEEVKETTGKLYQLLQKKLDEQLAEEK